MKVHGFKLILEPDATDGRVVTCLSWAGGYSQSDTVAEAPANITEARELSFKDMRARGGIFDSSGVLVIR